MKPVYKSSIYYTIQYTYKDTVTNDISKSDFFKVKDFADVQTHIDNEFERIENLREQQQQKIEIVNVQIESGQESIDYTTILDWEDARPGDYFIHEHSLNNILNSDSEISYDFYIAKLNREQMVIIDKYNICWHSYQGSYIITQYMENSNDKTSNTDIMTIYNKRMTPILNELEIEQCIKKVKIKIYKYASLFNDD